MLCEPRFVPQGYEDKGIAGCSKRLSSKAAANEGPTRTLGVRGGSERCENDAGGIFQHPANGLARYGG
jgi:hypothetical protein